MGIKEDCFGYNPEIRQCKALTELVCKNKECKFYKTQSQFEDGIKLLDEMEASRNGTK